MSGTVSTGAPLGCCSLVAEAQEQVVPGEEGIGEGGVCAARRGNDAAPPVAQRISDKAPSGKPCADSAASRKNACRARLSVALMAAAVTTAVQTLPVRTVSAERSVDFTSSASGP
mmetsp:Transcript_40676/g.96719  ORF Transcript_40676/g.96719 Transcript_40676/m.96719 type:complete len:115 (+) Transcript_40676:170-514(+)